MDDWRALSWFLTVALGVVLFLRIAADGMARMEMRLELLRRRKEQRMKEERESEIFPDPASVADRTDKAA